ncbi:hypothetical protein POM88_054612 [Heracleum sosnowskyi]|uniref:Uncharacterized protein n=1 Tax=Heracleum sosnowskyi TaxID=360622 RepID=A0AAD8GM05_9APIA|nr:hypothetical protein POM88_054612 [Heracleum sosnowskyi]
MKSLEQKAIQFISLVKQTFIDQPSKFQEFSNLITNPKSHNLISKLKTLFADHQDLIFGLKDFLPKQIDADHDDDDDDGVIEPPKKKPCTGIRTWFLRDSPSELFDKIRDRCIEKSDHEFRVLFNFSKTFLSYHENKINFYEADVIFKSLFKDDPDLFLESNRVLAQSLHESREKPDLSWTDEGIVECSLFEETMDAKEFYLFEMDMAFSRLESVIKKLDKDPQSLEESFTVLDVKCIKKLYTEDGDDGLGDEMIRILQFDLVGRIVARVVVLDRLRQKKTQLKEQKLGLDKVWNEIFEDIGEKGRVHRHRAFLQRTKRASNNGFGTKKQCRG